MGWYDTGLASATQGQAQALAGLASLKPVDYLSGIGGIMSKYGAEQQAEADKAKQLAMQQQGLDIQQKTFDNAMTQQQAKGVEDYTSKVALLNSLASSKPVTYGKTQLWGGLGMEGINPESLSALASTPMSEADRAEVAKSLPSLATLSQFASDRDKAEALKASKEASALQVQLSKEQTKSYKDMMLQEQRNKAMADFSIKASALGAKKYEDWLKSNPTKAMDSVEQAKAKAMIANEIKTELAPVYKVYGIDISTGDTGKALTDLVNTLQAPKTEAKSAIVSNTPSQDTNLRSELYDIAKKFKSANAPAFVPNWLGGDMPALGRYEAAQQALATKYNVPIETIRTTLKDIGY